MHTEQSTPFFSTDPKVQRKLEVSKASDPQEKEAESVARKIMSKQLQKAEDKEEDKSVQKAEKKEEENAVQKAEQKEEEKPIQKEEKKEEEKAVQKAEKEEENPIQKAADKEEENPIQKAETKEDEKSVQAKLKIDRKAMDNDVQRDEKENSSAAQPALEDRLKMRKGMGAPIPDEVRGEMEKKFGHTFGDVRIHTDSEAASMCDQVHALAFTHGNDIYFGAGQFNLNTSAGKELLAHELTHVVQQR
jgi:hypothetical protein